MARSCNKYNQNVLLNKDSSQHNVIESDVVRCSITKQGMFGFAQSIRAKVRYIQGTCKVLVVVSQSMR